MDKEFELFASTLPDNQKNASEKEYRTMRYWELNGKPKNFDEAVKLGMYTMNNEDGLYHANSVAYNKDADEYEFMKPSTHPTIQKEIDWYNSDDAKDFRKKYALDQSGDVWKYVRKNDTANWLQNLIKRNK